MGKTIEEAEDRAFAKFEKETACRHLWGREHYANGGQLCRHCRAFRCGHVKEIVQLGQWRKPVNWFEATWLTKGDDPYVRLTQIRMKLFGVTPRPEALKEAAL